MIYASCGGSNHCRKKLTRVMYFLSLSLYIYESSKKALYCSNMQKLIKLLVSDSKLLKKKNQPTMIK